MRLDGKTVIAAPREKVWSFLTDPASVSGCAPGLESLEVVVPGEKFRVMAAVGFGAVKARFATDVVWLDLEEPRRACMKAHGMAAVGAADATATMTLEDGADGSTEVTWRAEVSVAGPIAGLASRLLQGISKRVTNAFFDCVRRSVEAGARKPGRHAGRHGRKV